MDIKEGIRSGRLKKITKEKAIRYLFGKGPICDAMKTLIESDTVNYWWDDIENSVVIGAKK